MAVFTVTTASDVVADDGLLSLREALALAQGSAGADTITFASGLQFIAIDQVLEIQSGEDVTIDGDINGDGILDVAINGQNATRLINVAAGANLTLNYIGLVNGQDNPAAAASGTSGGSGSDGAHGLDGGYYGSSGTDGANGGDGQDGSDGSDGADAVGGIFNAGNLTIRGVVFGYNSAAGGNGGNGGAGGYGGNGGNGGNGQYGGYGVINQPGGDGGHGGSGGNGGNGGNGGSGGDAATAILNAAGGSVTIADSAFSGGYVGGNFFGYAGGAFGGNGGYGGSGGQGGFGGNGGNGGDGSYHGPLGYYGYGGYYYTPSYRGPGGNAGAGGGGGSGGAGGNSGDGGSAGGFILNRGTVTSTGASAGTGGNAIGGSYNFAGAGGSYGFGGSGGFYGYGQPSGGYGGNGSNGSFGANGLYGLPGQTSTTILNLDGGTGSMSFADTVVYIHPTDVIVLEGTGGTTTVTFNVNRVGSLAEQIGVSWTVTGANAADFLGGVRPSGTATILSGSAGTQVSFQVVGDSIFELDETFTITLTSISDPVGGPVAAFGTTSVQGQIIDNDPGPVRLFTSATFATLVDDFATLGAALSTATAGQAILIDETFAPPLGNVGAVTIGVNDLTIDADPPFDAAFTLGAGVTALTLRGSASIDVTGNALANAITGNSGSNILDGREGSDIMRGLGGSDNYFVDNVGDVVDESLPGSNGNDIVRSTISVDLENATRFKGDIERVALLGSDDINALGNALDNILWGNTGDNFINGRAGADTMRGVDGDDTYVVDNVADVVDESWTGSGGVDTVRSTLSVDLEDTSTFKGDIERVLVFGNTNISVLGNALSNELTGNAGNNLLNGRVGADTMRGLGGNDTYVVDNAGDVVDESAGGSGGIDTVRTTVGVDLSNSSRFMGAIEHVLLFGTGDFALHGNALNNELTGNVGNNFINGRSGADTMRGLAGDDTYVIDGLGDVVDESVAGSGGTDTVRSTISVDLSDGIRFKGNIENAQLFGNGNISLVGNGLANELTGNSGNNFINGGSGGDLLRGLGGDDTYRIDDVTDVVDEAFAGSNGNDTIRSTVSVDLNNAARFKGAIENIQLFGVDDLNAVGNSLQNIIVGNNGDNFINGRGGNDILSGLGGADTFLFNSPLGPTNVDQILDFTVGLDSIRLENAIFTGLSSGPLTAAAFSIGTAATTAAHRIIYDNLTGDLFFDADGSGIGAQVQFASLGAGLGLTEADFLVV